MARKLRKAKKFAGSFASRTGATRGLTTRPRFELQCLACGHRLAVSIAPPECPLCRGSVWEYRPPESDRSHALPGDPSASRLALASKVIGSNSVRRWRFDQLQRAGYPVGDAFVLSGRRDVDLHQASRLLANGCALALAVEILI